MTNVKVTEQFKQIDFLHNKVNRLPINGDTVYIRTVTGQPIGEFDTVVFADYTTNTYRTQFYTLTLDDQFDVLEFDNKVIVDGITYVRESKENGNIQKQLNDFKAKMEQNLSSIGEELAAFDDSIHDIQQTLKENGK